MATQAIPGEPVSKPSGAADRAETLPFRIKFGWASGAFGASILLNGAAGLMLFYLTKIVGLPGWIAGIILMVSKLFDIVSDPLVGWLSDRHRSPSGRRRPFLLVGAFVNALALLLIFTVPFRGDGMATILYVLAVNLVYTIGYSIFNVPLLAMPAEITDGYHERSTLQGWRVIAASSATAIAVIGSGAVLGMLGQRTGPGGAVVNSAHDYAILAALFAALTFAGMITGWRMTRGARTLERTLTKAPLRDQWASFFGNKPAMIIIGVKAAQLIGIASTGSATLFMIVDVLRGSPAQLPFIGLASLATSIVATPLLARLSKRIGKRAGYLIGATATAAAGLSWIFAVPGESVGWLMLRGALSGVAFSGNVMFAMSMLNDAMELDVHRTGMRREGLYSAFYSFVEKFGSALGPAVIGAALSIAGFDSTASITASNAAAVREATLLGIAYIPAGCALIAVILLAFYHLDEDALAQARADSLIDDVR